MMERPIHHQVTRIADEMAPVFKRRFLTLVRNTMEPNTVRAINNFVMRRNFRTILDLIDWELFRDRLVHTLEAPMKETWDKAGALAIAYVIPNRKDRWRFDTMELLPLAHIQQHAQQVAGEITDQTREGFNDTLEYASAVESMNSSQGANWVRNLFGLTMAQALATRNLHRSLLQAGNVKAYNLAMANARRQLEYRGRRMGSTEAFNMANYGILTGVQQAVVEGVAHPGLSKRWITVQDDRQCASCRSMHGQVVPLTDEYRTVIGSRLNPPLHVGCRCSMSFPVG